MTPYTIRLTKEAAKDVALLPPRLKDKLRIILLQQVAPNPRCGQRLVGDLAGFFSLRLTYKDRLVYSIDADSRTVFVHRARTHYGD
ncbi:MAG: type II toxin-antitoxin system YoeB family toxin [Kiritimatiellaeota bacterium]|nr:type II toxin-antitoxin system YoeB family toxin [Kiritimatiellota bacterium]